MISGWQPIETAPKSLDYDDPIIVWLGDRWTAAIWRDGIGWFNVVGAGDRAWDEGEAIHPTLWMRPSPPIEFGHYMRCGGHVSFHVVGEDFSHLPDRTFAVNRGEK